VSTEDDSALELPYAQYECPVCGKDLPLAEARMAVTCAEHRPAPQRLEFTIRAAGADDRRAIESICDQAFGETDVDTFGRVFDILACDNYIAEVDGGLAGLLSLATDKGEAAAVLFSVYPHFQGREIGSALVEAGVAYAVERGLPGLKAAVSNDDLPTLYFFQRHGFVICDVVVGLLADRLGYAGSGFAGIPMRDEIRLRRPVCP
jgi:GNAT superfamily N-acetyltransferase